MKREEMQHLEKLFSKILESSSFLSCFDENFPRASVSDILLYFLTSRCKKCKGEKTTKAKSQLNVRIEKGMRDGERIVFEGEGDHEVSTTEAFQSF